ncbi:MAG: hypothetical protein GX442_11965 [Candidatus Riflebacteria bacterium]|nr:hypothetical protein [Candidatus Riflebacteria bacterium]
MTDWSFARVHPSNRGGIMIMTALGLAVLLAFVALVTDIGFLYFQKARVETAVSAGWKAALDLAAVSPVDANGGLTSQARTAIYNRVGEVINQTYGMTTTVAPLTWQVDYNTPIPTRNYIRVTAWYDTRLFFANVLGITNKTVAGWRGAPFEDGGEGVIPIGLPHGILRQWETHKFTFEKFGQGQGFTPGNEYILRLGNVKGSNAQPPDCGGTGTIPNPDPALQSLRNAANHGSLDMGSKGGGARDYEEFFKFGYPGPVNINDRIYFKPGTMHGPNDDGRDFRTLLHPELKRVVVPIIDWPADPTKVPQENNGSPQVRVIGFAIFDLIPVEDYTKQDPPTGLGVYGDNQDSDQVRGIFVNYLVHPDEVAGSLT